MRVIVEKRTDVTLEEIVYNYKRIKKEYGNQANPHMNFECFLAEIRIYHNIIE